MHVSRYIPCALLGLLLLPAAGAATTPQQDSGLTREEQRWLERLPKEDAEAVGRSIGWEAPEFPDDARWHDGNGPTLESLRGKVVLVQTFSTRGSGRSGGTRIARSIAPLVDEEDFVAIAVHTPEGLDRVDTLLPQLKLEVPVLLDEKGTWCDSVGAFRRPVTYMIDRRGNVRYASVSSRDVEDAARKLLDEDYDASATPTKREEKKATSTDEVTFPTFTNSVGSSTDRRGQEAAPFYVQEIWRQPVGDATGKVVVLDFWATWCGPCRAAIPHMNEIQNHYGDKVICLGITSETKSKFESGMLKAKLKANDFAYGLAIDSNRTLSSFFGVKAIPHVAVLSGDWVVRWQGSPSGLNRKVLDSIVNANDAMLELYAGEMGNALPPQRWKAWVADQDRRNNR